VEFSVIAPDRARKPPIVNALHHLILGGLHAEFRPHGLSLRLPAISTGVYGYPIEAATSIAIQAVSGYLSEHGNAPEVTFCCFSERDLAVYRQVLERGPTEERPYGS